MKVGIVILALCACYASATFVRYCRPYSLGYGSYSPRLQYFRSGQTVTYRCNSGYRLVGVATHRCYRGRWNQRRPTCVARPPVQCRRPAEPDYGYILPRSGQLFDVNAKIWFKCNGRFQLSGQKDLTCLASGRWSHRFPVCVARCPQPDIPRFGSISPEQDLYDVDVEVTFSCSGIYVVDGAERITCLDDGTWSDDEPTCVAPTCDQPDIPDNGAIRPVKTTYRVRDRVWFSCTDPYRREGRESIICLPSGEWSHDEPICVARCPQPDIPRFGSISPEQDLYDVDDEVTFSCSGNKVISGERILTCLDDGTWSDDEPTCVDPTCEVPVAPDNGDFGPVREVYRPRAKVWFSCDTGYSISGQKDIECGGNGEWSHPFPTCTRSSCDPPPVPRFGAIRPVKDTYDFGDTVWYSCRTGYIIRGARDITCRSPGNWPNVEVQCVPDPNRSCVGRCNRYDHRKPCQCNYFCQVRRTCCDDYSRVCRRH